MVRRAFASALPAAWRSAIPVRLDVIPGYMSSASSSGTIQVSQGHINAGPAIVRAVLAHEFGHLLAFRYGSQAITGAAPPASPYSSPRPEQARAARVRPAFTGLVSPSPRLPDCGGGRPPFPLKRSAPA